MIALVVYLVLFLGSTFGLVYVSFKKENELGAFFIFPMVFFVSLSIVFISDACNMKDKEMRFATEYTTMRSLIESKDFNRQIFLVKNKTYDEVQYIDKKIELNKKRVGNLWNGKRFSKEIAQYELLTPIFNKNEKNFGLQWNDFAD